MARLSEKKRIEMLMMIENADRARTYKEVLIDAG